MTKLNIDKKADGEITPKLLFLPLAGEKTKALFLKLKESNLPMACIDSTMERNKMFDFYAEEVTRDILKSLAITGGSHL